MSVKVEVTNAGAVSKALAKHFEDGLRPALEKTRELVEAKFQNNPAGWVPLAAATLAQRQRLGFGTGPMLYRTGHLQGQAVQELVIDSPTEGHISTSDPMALLQNNGGGNIPARQFYSLDDAEKKEVIDAFKSGIK
jgi:phage gpG-like protein